MCIFCAAIPLTASVGAHLNAKQKAGRKMAEEKGNHPVGEKPIVKVTVGAVILLTVCSVVYHLVLSPILRI